MSGHRSPAKRRSVDGSCITKIPVFFFFHAFFQFFYGFLSETFNSELCSCSTCSTELRFLFNFWLNFWLKFWSKFRFIFQFIFIWNSFTKFIKNPLEKSSKCNDASIDLQLKIGRKSRVKFIENNAFFCHFCDFFQNEKKRSIFFYSKLRVTYYKL